MKSGLRGPSAFLIVVVLVVGSCRCSSADDSEGPEQLTLADLAAYRVALAGKETTDPHNASKPSPLLSFKDLWTHPDAFRGRRVTVDGRVERIFRQGPVGSFPALAEIWIASRTGDPFCLVVPQARGNGMVPTTDDDLDSPSLPNSIPTPGQKVRFTGTFLKLVRYASGDGARLAPLIVGDKPPAPTHETAGANAGSGRPGDGAERGAGLPASGLVCLALALLTAFALASRHFFTRSGRLGLRQQHRRTSAYLVVDPPLEFIEPPNQP